MDVKEEAPSSPEPSEESQNNIKVLPQKVKLIEMSLETIFIFFFFSFRESTTFAKLGWNRPMPTAITFPSGVNRRTYLSPCDACGARETWNSQRKVSRRYGSTLRWWSTSNTARRLWFRHRQAHQSVDWSAKQKRQSKVWMATIWIFPRRFLVWMLIKRAAAIKTASFATFLCVHVVTNWELPQSSRKHRLMNFWVSSALYSSIKLRF